MSDRKPATAGKRPPKTRAKAEPAAAEPKPTMARKSEKDAGVLLSGGNPQIAKGDGDAPV